MAQRQTRKAGILKPRVADQALQKTLDSVIERLEVLDNIRGDFLDSAVTYRALQDSGFKISSLGNVSGGTTQIINTPPDSGDGPGIGPSSPPSALAVNETYLALLLTWTNPSTNLQHIEVWRSSDDVLGNATLIGTTVSPQYVDYVGANATYYYWVRTVATDGSTTAYNDTAGTEGTTGVDPGQILLDPTNFRLQDGVDVIAPFLVGEIDGLPAVGLSGTFIVDGSIRSTSIIAGSIGTREIFVENLSAISADLGTVTAGMFCTTDPVENVDAWRVCIGDQALTAYPIWYGAGPVSGPNGRFYVDQNGNVVIKGLLQAGMIDQSFFAADPDAENAPFRIACEYPSDPTSYSGGVYTGRAAHIVPTFTTGYTAPPGGKGEAILDDYDPLVTANYPISWYSDGMTLYSPTYTGHDVEYGRLGTLSEQINIRYYAYMRNEFSDQRYWLLIFYKYDDEPEQRGFVHDVTAASRNYEVHIYQEQSFATRATAWNTLRIRMGLACEYIDGADRGWAQEARITMTTANLGFADATTELTPWTYSGASAGDPRFINPPAGTGGDDGGVYIPPDPGDYEVLP